MIPLAAAGWQQFTGRVDEALRLVKVPHSELISHGAADPAAQVALPAWSGPRRSVGVAAVWARPRSGNPQQPLDISQAGWTACPDH